MTEFRAWLTKEKACSEAMEWLEARDGRQAWEECPRGDWLLWWAVKRKIDRKLLVMATCGCARLASLHVKAGELRPLKAIETAEAWCRGEVALKEVHDAAYAAAAAGAYAASYAAYAAAAAAYAADYAAPYAAAAAAAYAARAAADAADASDAREKIQQECADIVRRMIPFDVVCPEVAA
jgi:hypothetical protein